MWPAFLKSAKASCWRGHIPALMIALSLVYSSPVRYCPPYAGTVRSPSLNTLAIAGCALVSLQCCCLGEFSMSNGIRHAGNGELKPSSTLPDSSSRVGWANKSCKHYCDRITVGDDQHHLMPKSAYKSQMRPRDYYEPAYQLGHPRLTSRERCTPPEFVVIVLSAAAMAPGVFVLHGWMTEP